MRRLDFDLDSNYSNLRPAKAITPAEVEQAKKDLEGALMGDSPMPTATLPATLPATTPAEQRSEDLREKSQAQNKMALLGLLALFGIVYVVSKK